MSDSPPPSPNPGSDGFNDFLIDVVIGNFPDLTGIHEHPMEFEIDFPRLGKIVPKGGLNRRMLDDVDSLSFQ